MTSSPRSGARGSHAGIWLAALVLIAAVASALLTGGARSASPQGLIAFMRAGGVYVMHPDGSGVRLLWRGDAGPKDLSWSPDGSRLAISTWDLEPSYGQPTAKVWIVNADGKSPVPVAQVAADSLSWTPDGRIAFTARRGCKASTRVGFVCKYTRATEDPDVWVMNADGSGMRRLKRTPELWESNVDWKPTGGWLAFDSGGWVPEVHVIRTDGSGLREVTPGWVSGTQPDWSPDGRRIAYARPVAFPETPNSIAPENDEIWITNASGTSHVRLTKNRLYDSSPAWSPDGRRIAFVRESKMIHVMNADGMSQKRLTTGANPAWQPPLTAP